MLVKQSIVENWYCRESAIYKNFAYLFQNPLWHKDIPKGFSVCPYFWLSLFSLFIFRPLFVWPIANVCRPIIQKMGRPASWLDEKVFNGCQRVMNFDGDYHSGFGFLASWLVIGIGSLVGLLVSALWEPTKTLYGYCQLTEAATVSFWGLTSFVSLLVFILFYKLFKWGTCKVQNYIYLWAVMFTIALLVFSPETVISGVAGIFSAVGHALASVFKSIWFAITWVGKWLWAGATFSVFGLVWEAYIVIALLVLWAMIKVIEVVTGDMWYPSSEPKDVKAVNRLAWLRILSKVIQLRGDTYRKGEVFSDSYYLRHRIMNSGWMRAIKMFREDLYMIALNLTFREQLDKLQEYYPVVTDSVWTAMKTMNLEDRFSRINALEPCQKLNVGFNFDSYQFSHKLWEAVENSDVSEMIRNQAEHFLAMDVQRELRRERSVMRKWCNSTAEKLGEFVSGIMALGLWILKNIATLFAYLWMLVKAKKQGACPYFRFTDSNNE